MSIFYFYRTMSTWLVRGVFSLLLVSVPWINARTEEQISPAPREISPTAITHASASQLLLRYGNKTPTFDPKNFNELALQRGFIKSKIKRIRGNNVNRVFRGAIVYHKRTIPVLIKPDTGLTKKQLRSSIPIGSDNRRADAAFHLSKFIDLVDTPEHVIRDDAPINQKNLHSRGGAGIQIFSLDSHAPTKNLIAQVQSPSSINRLGDELEEIAVFDTLIGNTDRHLRNWLFRHAPKHGQRHIVAIDHTLAFPVVNKEDNRCNYLMIDSYIRSSGDGTISHRNLQKLEALSQKKVEVNQVLGLNLEPEAINLLWDRVDRMLKEKKVFYPFGEESNGEQL